MHSMSVPGYILPFVSLYIVSLWRGEDSRPKTRERSGECSRQRKAILRKSNLRRELAVLT
jgi:hypothetical protein